MNLSIKKLFLGLLLGCICVQPSLQADWKSVLKEKALFTGGAVLGLTGLALAHVGIDAGLHESENITERLLLTMIAFTSAIGSTGALAHFLDKKLSEDVCLKGYLTGFGAVSVLLSMVDFCRSQERTIVLEVPGTFLDDLQQHDPTLYAKFVEIFTL